MRRFLFCLLLILPFAKTFAQVFTYNETFTNSKADSIVFGGSPNTAFLTADPKRDVKDPEGKGFLRLTDASNNQKGYIYCKIPFSSAQGFSIQFEYFTYNGGLSGADGITFFLFDANAVKNNAFNIGGFGGSLGYAQYIDFAGTSYKGLSKAYLGVGIDEYGNFKMKREGRPTGIDPTTPNDPPRNSITIRGPESSNYAFITNVQTKDVHGFEIGTGAIRATDSLKDGYRRCYIDMQKINGDSKNGYYLTVRIMEGGANPKLHTVVDKMEYKYVPPDELMYGIASSTGNSINVHEIRNVQINSYALNPPKPPLARDDKFEIYTSTNAVPLDIVKNDTAEIGHTIPLTNIFLDKSTSANGALLAVDPLTGLVSYTPKAGFSGIDNFTYYIKDERGLKSPTSATVTVTVRKPPEGSDDNPPPIIIGSTLLNYDVKTNDADKVNVTYRLVKRPLAFSKHPSFFRWRADGTFDYTADKDSMKNVINDSFSYRIIDNNGVESADILVRIVIKHPPIARDDAYYIPVNKQVRFTPVVDNDVDPDGTESINDLATRTRQQTDPDANIINDCFPQGDGAYQPTAIKHSVSTQFTYQVEDKDRLKSNTATVKLFVYPQLKLQLTKAGSYVEADNRSYDITYKLYLKNTNPVIAGFDYQMDLTNLSIIEDLGAVFGSTPFTIKKIIPPTIVALNPLFTGKKANASDIVGIELLDKASSKLVPGQSDSIQLVVNVKFNRFSPWSLNNIAEASGKFPKLIIDSTVLVSASKLLTLPVPVKPTVADTVFERYTDDTPVSLDIFRLVQVASGKNVDKRTLKIVADNTTYVNYQIQPDSTVKFNILGKEGTAIFKYVVQDTKKLESDSGSITFLIKPIPKGADDQYYILANSSLPMNVRANDEAGSLAYNVDLSTTSTKGRVDLNADRRTHTYYPPQNYYGNDSFTYRLRRPDNNKSSAPIKVSIYINNPPVGRDSIVTINAGESAEFYVPSLTTDLDGTVDPSSVVISNSPTYEGTFSAVSGSPGRYRFVASQYFAGTTSFQYVITDNDPYIKGTSEIKKVTIIVIGKDNPPPPPPPGSNKIGVAKELASVKRVQNRSFDIKYVFTIKNYGNDPLDNISLKDDLGLAFNNAQFIIKSVTTQGSLTKNDAYNGLSVTELLDKSKSSLAGGVQETVELLLNVTLLDKEGIYINTANVQGTAPNGEVIKDQSTSGKNPDPAGDGNVSPKDPTLVELLFPGIFIPEGFSPNNDGINDTFVITNPNESSNITFEVFNRWGNRVYKSDNYKNDWGGKCSEGLSLGEDLPSGTYFYIIVINRKDKYTGYITLNR